MRVIRAPVSDTENDECTFNVANNGQSSSILEMGTHMQHHPGINMIASFVQPCKTIRTIYAENHILPSSVNFLNIDIQGAELLALRDMGAMLNQFDYLYLEVNGEQVCRQLRVGERH